MRNETLEPLKVVMGSSLVTTGMARRGKSALAPWEPTGVTFLAMFDDGLRARSTSDGAEWLSLDV